MTDTYISSNQQCHFATNRIMFALFNAAGSGKVIRIYRLWMRNIQLTGLTGIATIFEWKRISTMSGGFASQISRYSTANAAIPAEVSGAHQPTVTEGAIMRRFPWSNDEPQILGNTCDEIQLQRPLACYWDSAYNDSNVEPIVLREGQGMALKCITTIAITAFADISCEFTMDVT